LLTNTNSFEIMNHHTPPNNSQPTNKDNTALRNSSAL